MRYLALLTPVLLLLLMVLLGRLERWLEEATPQPPSRPGYARWRRAPRSVRARAAVETGGGRRLLAHRVRAGARRRAAVAVPRTPVTPVAERRRVLRRRLRAGR